jgi:ribosomal-protein-alanine N-acetyltransferase
MADEAVKVRRATEADEAVLRELWSEFELEVPAPEGFPPETWAEEWADTRRQIGAGTVFLAEDGEGAAGVAKSEERDHGAFHIHLVYVRPAARRRGVANALLQECVAQARAVGAPMITLHVLVDNEPARTVWRRLGFRDVSMLMATPVDVVAKRLAPRGEGEHRATTHAQTDDEQSVERAIAQFIPRLEAPDVRRAESWIRVADTLLDRDREAHGRFARELSERLGAVTVALALEGEVVRFRLYERGRMVDEYLSVPNYYEALPKGDELALAANPTLVSRLTGAAPDEVRRVARTAASPHELPPANELYVQLAQLMGLEA